MERVGSSLGTGDGCVDKVSVVEGVVVDWSFFFFFLICNRWRRPWTFFSASTPAASATWDMTRSHAKTSAIILVFIRNTFCGASNLK